MILRFTPRAWAKLVTLRDLSKNEVGGFGLSSEHDPLLVEDFLLVKQEVGSANVDFDDDYLAEWMEMMAGKGYHPNRFMRIWIHTHPFDSPNPSGTDESTFRDVFSGCNWSVMFILATSGKTYTRINFNMDDVPVGSFESRAMVDWQEPFEAADPTDWLNEYDNLVSESRVTVYTGSDNSHNHAGYQGQAGNGHDSDGNFNRLQETKHNKPAKKKEKASRSKRAIS